MAEQLLIACVGNIFLGDDAFGVEVAQRLSRRSLPDDVRVVDFGIRSYDLAYALMEPWELVILVDAAPRGGAPGTVYTIEPELPANDAPAGFDAHTLNPVAVLQLIAALGGQAARMLVVGCEPACCDPATPGATGLSPAVEQAVEPAIGAIEELIHASRQAKAA